MRRRLIWALGATGVLTVAALWTESKPAKVIAAVTRSGNLATPAPPPRTASTLPPLPATLPPIDVEPAQRDIFAPVEPPAPKVVAPPPAPPPPPPPAPTAPALSLRYLGSMVTPAGERIVLLARGDVSVPIQPGTKLDEGYVVEDIGLDAVHLLYPPLGTKVDIPIPPAAPTR